jgi:hypothetical protein
MEYSHFKEAFENASKYGTVILQEHAKGDDFRITVIDGKVVTVLKRYPLSVFGDGASSIIQLLEAKLRWRAAQEDFQGFNDISPRAPEILFMLEKQRLTFQDILAKGRRVFLRSNANISSGGELECVTDECHPAVKELAVSSATLLGLDLAGVDYITTDITRPWNETGGQICEINPTPALFSANRRMLLEAFFSRLKPACPSQISGDILLIKDCSCDIQEWINSECADFNFQDLRILSQLQYFFQSYLLARTGRFLCQIDNQTIKEFGIVNINFRKVASCKKCFEDQEILSDFMSQYEFFEESIFV